MDINATLLGHVIWFGVFIWITMKYIWPPLQKAMHERQQEIAGGLAAAEQGRRDLEQAEKKSQDVITEARANASEIIGQAEKRGAEVVEELKHLIDGAVWIAAGTVNFIHYHNWLEAIGKGFLGNKACLRHRPVYRVYQ